MRGIVGAVVGVVVGVLVVVAAVVVTVTVPRTADGSPTAAPPTEASEDPYPDIVPLATTPTPRWSVPMSDVGLPEDQRSLVRPDVLAANTTTVIGGTEGYDAALMAFDPLTGEQKWPKVSDFRAEACEFSRDGRLACVGRGADEATADVAFLDVASGQVVATKPVHLGERSTGPQLQSAGDGFLVSTRYFVEKENRYALSMTWLSSDGSRSWEQKPPPGFYEPSLSEAGNVVAISDRWRAVRVFALDTGELVYDSVEDQKNAAREERTAFFAVAPVRTGFAVSIGAGTPRTMIYDGKGARRGVIEGFGLAYSPPGSEGDLIPVERDDGRDNTTIGVASTENLEVIATTTAAHGLSRVKILHDRFLLGNRHGEDDWTVLDVRHPEQVRAVAPGDTTLMAFDGTRAFFADNSGSQGRVPYVFGWDLATGRQVWEIGKRYSEAHRDLRFVGPYLFRMQSGDPDEASITRLGA
ncbi:hypothetical protein [Gordonia aurantiaca]|uniref:hypothetical protein n=1 Tax=Gordonia sp. B21 TaxID=3151852 RepID=UPI0032634E44